MINIDQLNLIIAILYYIQQNLVFFMWLHWYTDPEHAMASWPYFRLVNYDNLPRTM